MLSLTSLGVTSHSFTVILPLIFILPLCHILSFSFVSVSLPQWVCLLKIDEQFSETTREPRWCKGSVEKLCRGQRVDLDVRRPRCRPALTFIAMLCNLLVLCFHFTPWKTTESNVTIIYFFKTTKCLNYLSKNLAIFSKPYIVKKHFFGTCEIIYIKILTKK